LWLLVHTYSALLSRIESVGFAVFGSVCGFQSGKDDVHRQRRASAATREEISLKSVIVIGAAGGTAAASRWLNPAAAFVCLNSVPI